MTIQELKTQIENKTLSDDFLILVCEQNHFLADQYVEAIANFRNCDIIPIESIYEPKLSTLSVVIDFETNLNVLRVDVFEERAANYGQFTSTIVICDKVDKKLEATLADYIVKIPPIEDWCIKDYVKMLCPKVNSESVDWLFSVTHGDIYRIVNEVDKLTIFDKDEHQAILNALRFDPCTDLFEAPDSFTLAKIIAQRNKAGLLEFLRHIKSYKFDNKNGGVQGIVTNILTKYVIASYIFTQSGVSLKDTGLGGQAYHVRDELKGISIPYVQKAIEFLSNVNLRLVSGQLDLPDDKFIEYIICHLMSL